MKTAKLVIGIMSIVLSMVVIFQSCAAGLGEAMAGEGTSGGAGAFVAVLILAAGIVAIAARSSRGGAICCTIIYALAGILGLTASGIFTDLMIWGVVSIIFALLFLISAIMLKKEDV
jgi:hypothetical protein